MTEFNLKSLGAELYFAKRPNWNKILNRYRTVKDTSTLLSDVVVPSYGDKVLLRDLKNHLNNVNISIPPKELIETLNKTLMVVDIVISVGGANARYVENIRLEQEPIKLNDLPEEIIGVVYETKQKVILEYIAYGMTLKEASLCFEGNNLAVAQEIKSNYQNNKEVVDRFKEIYNDLYDKEYFSFYWSVRLKRAIIDSHPELSELKQNSLYYPDADKTLLGEHDWINKGLPKWLPEKYRTQCEKDNLLPGKVSNEKRLNPGG